MRADFCPDAEVVSYFPISEAAAEGQRKRWEQGHVALSYGLASPCWPRAIVEGNRNLLGLLLDIAIPPASMLVVALLTLACASLVLFLRRPAAPAPLLPDGVDFSYSRLRSAWPGPALVDKSCRSTPPSPILSYMVKKFVLYARMLRHRGPFGWNRTDRDGSSNDLPKAVRSQGSNPAEACYLSVIASDTVWRAGTGGNR